MYTVQFQPTNQQTKTKTNQPTNQPNQPHCTQYSFKAESLNQARNLLLSWNFQSSSFLKNQNQKFH
jgi:hypothetical protein